MSPRGADPDWEALGRDERWVARVTAEEAELGELLQQSGSTWGYAPTSPRGSGKSCR